MTTRTSRILASTFPLAIASLIACGSSPTSGLGGGSQSGSSSGSSSGGGSSGGQSSSGASSGGNGDTSSSGGSSSGASGSSGAASGSGGPSSGVVNPPGDDGGASEDGGVASSNPCAPIPDVPGTTNVPVTFEFNTGTTTPPAETGGTLAGQWLVTKATLYLPAGLQGLVNLGQSTGTVNVFGVFDGDVFRFDAIVNITVSSVLGGQPLQTTYDFQGTDTTSGSTFTIDTTCGDAGPPPFTATYTASGTTGTIDLAIQVQGGTADMVLEATVAP